MASLRAAQAQLLRNSSFLDQIAGSLLFSASQIVNESAGAANHANRATLANAILQNPASQASVFAPGLLTNATIAAAAATPDAITDNDVDFVVASLFNVYANQRAATQIAAPPPQIAK
jgi:methylmalonyl-CoA mutase cobalamin-binding subunit